MMCNKDDVFGSIPPGQPPAEESLEVATKANYLLRCELLSMTKAFIDVAALAFGIREDKEFGCDRCSDCTFQISAIIHKWLESESCKNPDVLLTKIHQFSAFPRALLKIISGCVKIVQSSKDVQEEFAVQISKLCDEAEQSLQKRKYLTYSRIAQVLFETRPDIEAALTNASGWQDLSQRLDNLKVQARNLADNLTQSSDAFTEKSPFGADGKRPVRKWKRACGGGFVQQSRPNGIQDDGPMFVIDFNHTHILAVVKSQVMQPLTNYHFYPCQRELPFKADFRPVARANCEQQVFPVRSNEMKIVSGYYQVFRIARITPFYYYLSLCACASTNHQLAVEHRIIDTYDWPEAAEILSP